MYVLCFTRPRHQVSVYRTIRPLVIYSDYFPLVDKSQPDVHSISNLLQLLSNNVYIKKSKNVEVLHLAAEVFLVYSSCMPEL